MGAFLKAFLLSTVIVSAIVALLESIRPVYRYRRWKYPEYWMLYDEALAKNKEFGEHIYSSSYAIDTDVRAALSNFFDNALESVEEEFITTMKALHNRNVSRIQLLKAKEEDTILAWAEVQKYALENNLKWGLIEHERDSEM